MRKTVAALLAACVLGLTSPGAVAREPTPEERQAIERVLRQHGYTAWEEIELDGGVWQVDRARDGDGRSFDLKLDARSLTIVEQTE